MSLKMRKCRCQMWPCLLSSLLNLQVRQRLSLLQSLNLLNLQISWRPLFLKSLNLLNLQVFWRLLFLKSFNLLKLQVFWDLLFLKSLNLLNLQVFWRLLTCCSGGASTCWTCKCLGACCSWRASICCSCNPSFLKSLLNLWCLRLSFLQVQHRVKHTEVGCATLRFLWDRRAIGFASGSRRRQIQISGRTLTSIQSQCPRNCSTCLGGVLWRTPCWCLGESKSTGSFVIWSRICPSARVHSQRHLGITFVTTSMLPRVKYGKRQELNWPTVSKCLSGSQMSATLWLSVGHMSAHAWVLPCLVWAWASLRLVVLVCNSEIQSELASELGRIIFACTTSIVLRIYDFCMIAFCCAVIFLSCSTCFSAQASVLHDIKVTLSCHVLAKLDCGWTHVASFAGKLFLFWNCSHQ